MLDDPSVRSTSVHTVRMLFLAPLQRKNPCKKPPQIALTDPCRRAAAFAMTRAASCPEPGKAQFSLHTSIDLSIYHLHSQCRRNFCLAANHHAELARPYPRPGFLHRQSWFSAASHCCSRITGVYSQKQLSSCPRRIQTAPVSTSRRPQTRLK